MMAVTVTTLDHLTAPLWAEIFDSLKRSAATALDAARAADKAGKPELAQHFANIGALEMEYAADLIDINVPPVPENETKEARRWRTEVDQRWALA